MDCGGYISSGEASWCVSVMWMLIIDWLFVESLAHWGRGLHLQPRVWHEQIPCSRKHFDLKLKSNVSLSNPAYMPLSKFIIFYLKLLQRNTGILAHLGGLRKRLKMQDSDQCSCLKWAPQDVGPASCRCISCSALARSETRPEIFRCHLVFRETPTRSDTTSFVFQTI